MRYFLLIFLSIFISCSENKDISNLSIFKYNEISGINSLDPAFSKDLASVWATAQLFNGLVQLDSNLNIQPCIAKSWEISNDKLVYDFLLKDDVYFHNVDKASLEKGRKVNAFDFEYSLNRLIDDNVASPGRWVLSNVKSFEAKNDSIFTIKLKSPFPGFLGELMYDNLMKKFNWGGLNNPSLYFDETNTRMVMNYRNNYSRSRR